MKISNLAYGLAGYVLGARAGHGRYDQIVQVARRVAGSQTVQSTAGVMRARVDRLIVRGKQKVIGAPASANGSNRYRPR